MPAIFTKKIYPKIDPFNNKITKNIEKLNYTKF